MAHSNSSNKKRLWVSAAALVSGDGKILVQRRPPDKPMAGLWEFPGGKVEIGEAPEEALVRELREELGIEVERNALIPVAFASEALGAKHLILLLYLVRDWIGDPAPLHATELCWIDPSSMRDLPMPPADYPLIKQLELALSAQYLG
jgi:8-oxo-dGTP diphosphatase